VQENNLHDKTRNENSKQLVYDCSKIFMQDPTLYTKSWWLAYDDSILIFAIIPTWCTFWTNKYLSTIIPTYHGTLFWKNKDAQVRKRCPTSIQHRLKNSHTHTPFWKKPHTINTNWCTFIHQYEIGTLVIIRVECTLR
jgi:hypothetical protein